MKTQILNPKLALTTAAAAVLLTGCASMDRGGYSGLNEPVNALAFTAPTDPVQISKWSGSRYLQLPLQSQDIYYFQVPDSGYNPSPSGFTYDTPGSDRFDNNFANDRSYSSTVQPLPSADLGSRDLSGTGSRMDVTTGTGEGMSSNDMAQWDSDMIHHRDSVGSAPASTFGSGSDSGSGGAKIIRHQPGNAR